MLEIAGVSKRFGTLEVLREVSLSVGAGEVVVVIGPSGSGKTTLLRCINLLEDYEQGTVTVDGEPIGYRLDPRTSKRQRMSEREIAASREHIGIVFQSYNLFPHMSVLQNIVAAPVRVKGVPRAKAEARARDLLAMVGLSDKADRISGAPVGRSATARRDRSRPGDGPEDHAVRRGDFRAGSRAGGRGAGGDAAARARRYDHGGGDA